MKKFLVLLLCCLAGAEQLDAASHVETRMFRARVTFYHARENKWGWETASGNRANEGRTVAAGGWAPFGKMLHIPQLQGVVGNGNFVVEDRGTDVASNKATHGKMRVLDIFVATRAKYLYCKSHCPPIMEVLLP